MTPAERAKAEEYKDNIRDKDRQALVDGKIGIYDFMSRSTGGQYSADYIQSVGEGRAFGSVVSGYNVEVQRAYAGLQQVIDDYRAGRASDQALERANAAAMAAFEGKQAEYERSLERAGTQL